MQGTTPATLARNRPGQSFFNQNRKFLKAGSSRRKWHSLVVVLAVVVEVDGAGARDAVLVGGSGSGAVLGGDAVHRLLTVGVPVGRHDALTAANTTRGRWVTGGQIRRVEYRSGECGVVARVYACVCE